MFPKELDIPFVTSELLKIHQENIRNTEYRFINIVPTPIKSVRSAIAILNQQIADPPEIIVTDLEFKLGNSTVVLNHVREPKQVPAGHSAGIVLDREVDVSRGDWLLGPESAVANQTLSATVAWLDDEPLVAGRVYWALHGHRWVKAKVSRIVHRLDIHTLQEAPATQLEANAIGHVELALKEPLAVRPYAVSRALGSLVLVDTATHKTAGAVLAGPAHAA